MTKLATITIDTAPANIAAMSETGRFHSWQDGNWRYSGHGLETVHCNDPTEQFDARATFGNCEVSAHIGTGLFSQSYRDGTRGIEKWDDKHRAIVWQIYKADYPEMQKCRDWLLSAFTTPRS
jgi:hypothetical protein